MARGKKGKPRSVASLTHGEASRRNIPTAEYHSVMTEEDKSPIQVAYDRRNRDLDPQLVWRGKYEQDAVGPFISKHHRSIFRRRCIPRRLIDDLMRQVEAAAQ